MAKKGKTGYMGMFAFIAVALNVVAWLLTIIFNAVHFEASISGMRIDHLLQNIASLILLLVVIFVAHDFAERQTKGWRIFFWILAIAALLSMFFGIGMGTNFFK